MRSRTLLLAAALAAAAALAPARAEAQRDTIRLAAPRDTLPERAGGDSIRMFEGDSAEAAPDSASGARRTPSRWAAPFSVEGSGRATPSRPPREVVWIHPDSIQREEEPAAADSADGDGDVVTLETGDAEPDSVEAPPRRESTRRTAAADSATNGRRSTTRRAAASEEETEGRSTRTASEDEGASEGRRSTRRASEEGEESASGRRTTSRATEEEGEATPRRSSTRRAADEGETETRRASEDGEAAEGRRATTTRSTTGTRGRTHTVAAGETLFGIARKYGATSAQLRALNPDVEWQNLDIGTVLRLPPARTGTTAARPASPSGERAATGQRTTTRATPPATSTRRRTHTVATGETLYGLARRYGVTVEAIKAANDMEADALRIGQTLVIPRAPAPR